MSLLHEIVSYNKTFVQEEKYTEYRTTKFANKKMVILTCMDTRLLDLLPRAMNLKNGDAQIIRNAGAIVSHRFGSIMRSILVALYELNAQEVLIIGHHDCGMASLKSDIIIDKCRQNGVMEDRIETLNMAGINLEKWLNGFTSVEESVASSVDLVKNHPLFPAQIPVHGMIIHPDTGQLEVVVDGY